MKRMIVFTATAMLAAVPAVAGLAGNSSLSPSVPVVSPSRAVVVDDRGGITPREDRTEVGDDRTATTGSSSPTATPSAANPPEPTDASSTDDSGQDGAGHDVGDDHGGHGSDG